METQPQKPTLEIVPVTVKAARRVVKLWHRHLPDVQGGLFAAAVAQNDDVVGVAIAGNPARVWQGTCRLVVSRAAVVGASKNACLMLYGAIGRAAAALGYSELWTYTLPGEPGTSLRAAGFTDMGLTDGGEHSRPSRYRKPAVRPEQKRRWMRTL
jgi:hypothetical protein